MRLPEKGVAVFQMHQPMPASGNCRLHVDQISVMENNLKSSKENAQNDSFPVGMRVLAVDDDPTCLRMLEGLLRACKYQVTVTNQANKALSLLRENKDKFDLVISDVHMPDMDGFKLLELVGLEMDLPVIMVSANGEIGNVMKGIKHGACDYLLKPIRLEELKNIWQHVIRKKGVDPKEPCIVGHGDQTDKINNANETSDQSSKLTRKHRDQSREEEDEVDDHFNEDLSAQKRPRVVWSAELHQQFLDAVNHLGIEKAVPKRILDLMNVPGLTRENVASHLQKYRLYLRKYSAEASQQCNMNASVGGGDSPFLFLDSRDGISGQSPNGALVSFDLQGPVNCFDGFGINGNTSGMIQFSNFQNSGTLSHYVGNQQNGLLQGLPTYIKIEEPHNNKQSSGFSGKTSNNLTVKNIHQQPLEFKGPNYQSPVCTSPIPNQFDRYGGTGSHLSFYDTGSAPWQRGVSIIGYANQQPIGVSLNSSDSAATDANSIAARKFETERDQVLIPCNPFEETKYGCSDISSEKSLATFPNVNAKQDFDSAPKQSLHGHKRDQGSNHNFMLPAGQHQGQNLGVCDGRINLDLRGKVNVGVLLSVQSCNDEQFKAGSPLDPLKLPSIFNPDSCSSADGLLNAMIKQISFLQQEHHQEIQEVQEHCKSPSRTFQEHTTGDQEHLHALRDSGYAGRDSDQSVSQIT